MANFLDIIKGEGPAVQLIKSLVHTGISGAEILSQVRDSGLGIRSATGYQVINYLRDNYIPGQLDLKALAEDVFPTIADIPKSITELTRNFSYRVAVSGTNINSGEKETQYIQLSTNQLLTKQQAVEVASNIIEAGQGNYGISFDEAEVDDIIQNNVGLVDTGRQLLPSPIPKNSKFDPTLGRYVPQLEAPYTPINPTSTPDYKSGDVVVPLGYSSIEDYYRDVFN